MPCCSIAPRSNARTWETVYKRICVGSSGASPNVRRLYWREEIVPPMPAAAAPAPIDYAQLAHDIKRWGGELGFQQTGISGIDLGADEARLLAWLDAGRHGEMDYMQR